MAAETRTVTCLNCGNDFDRPAGIGAGRGGKSPYCEDCRPKVRRARAEVRNLRHALALIGEFVEIDMPALATRRQELAEAQNGRCFDCQRPRRLYATESEDGGHVGLCLECTERRRANAVTEAVRA